VAGLAAGGDAGLRGTKPTETFDQVGSLAYAARNPHRYDDQRRLVDWATVIDNWCEAARRC
jgi:hypothetical protein